MEKAHERRPEGPPPDRTTQPGEGTSRHAGTAPPPRSEALEAELAALEAMVVEVVATPTGEPVEDTTPETEPDPPGTDPAHKDTPESGDVG